jgi:hypothetical protein
MRCPDSTRARLARAAAGGAALSEYSESELWEYIESLWRHRSPSKPGFRARELMTGARGDFVEISQESADGKSPSTSVELR